MTLWGVPGGPAHNQSRGWECIAGDFHYEQGEITTPCPTSTSLPQTPLLTLPTYCAAKPVEEPVSSTVEAESWTQAGFVKPPPYVWSGPLGEPLGFTECGELQFKPTIEVVLKSMRRARRQAWLSMWGCPRARRWKLEGWRRRMSGTRRCAARGGGCQSVCGQRTRSVSGASRGRVRRCGFRRAPEILRRRKCARTRKRRCSRRRSDSAKKRWKAGGCRRRVRKRRRSARCESARRSARNSRARCILLNRLRTGNRGRTVRLADRVVYRRRRQAGRRARQACRRRKARPDDRSGLDDVQNTPQWPLKN